MTKYPACAMECKFILARMDAHQYVTRLRGSLGARRKAAGLSQQKAADLIGCSRASLPYWEGGHSWPSSYWLPRMAAVYGCSIEELFIMPEEGGGT